MNSLREKRNYFESSCKNLKVGIWKNISRVSCPCCGYPTLGERAMYDICDLCDWEDDGQDDENASIVSGGPNSGYSLEQARINFQKYKTMYSPAHNTTTFDGDSDLRVSLKNELIGVFEEMLLLGSSKTNSLWKRALKLEKSLYKELGDSIKEYEKSIKP
jgi:hypothetical protein